MSSWRRGFCISLDIKHLTVSGTEMCNVGKYVMYERMSAVI